MKINIMVVHKKTVEYITECVYNSSNIIKSIYNRQTQTLYLFFHKGSGYSYKPVPNELYEQFENATSQGKFFIQHIKKNPAITYKSEFKLYDYEINEINGLRGF